MSVGRIPQETEVKWTVQLLSVKSSHAFERRDLHLLRVMFLEHLDSSCFHINTLDKRVFLHSKLKTVKAKAAKDFLLYVTS